MEYETILKFIDEINEYSDEEIINKINYIKNYLFDNNNSELRDEFLILSIKAVKSLDVKLSLIKQYFYTKYEELIYWEFQPIISALKNCNIYDKIEIFSKLFSIKFEEIKECLNIPHNLKFGVELEYSGIYLSDIKDLFKNKMIEPIMKSLSINSDVVYSIIKNVDFERQNEFDKWIFSSETSTGDGPEASSPIMTNTLNNLNQIGAIITLFNVLGARMHGGTGLHINIGVDYFENNIDALKYLLIIWGECEELFFKIANAENEIIRNCAINMATPIKENIEKFLEENETIILKNDEDIDNFMYNVQARNRLEELLKFNHGDLEVELMDAETEKDKYIVYKKYLKEKLPYDTSIRFTSVNFNHMTWNSSEKGRIEFRIFNSSLSIEIVMQNILLVGKLCEVSLKLSNNDKYKIEQLNELLNRHVTEEEKLDSLLNLLFDTESEKQIFKRRWSSVKDSSCYKKFKTGKKTFQESRQYILKNY